MANLGSYSSTPFKEDRKAQQKQAEENRKNNNTSNSNNSNKSNKSSTTADLVVSSDTGLYVRKDVEAAKGENVRIMGIDNSSDRVTTTNLGKDLTPIQRQTVSKLSSSSYERLKSSVDQDKNIIFTATTKTSNSPVKPVERPETFQEGQTERYSYANKPSITTTSQGYTDTKAQQSVFIPLTETQRSRIERTSQYEDYITGLNNRPINTPSQEKKPFLLNTRVALGKLNDKFQTNLIDGWQKRNERFENKPFESWIPTKFNLLAAERSKNVPLTSAEGKAQRAEIFGFKTESNKQRFERMGDNVEAVIPTTVPTIPSMLINKKQTGSYLGLGTSSEFRNFGQGQLLVDLGTTTTEFPFRLTQMADKVMVSAFTARSELLSGRERRTAFLGESKDALKYVITNTLNPATREGRLSFATAAFGSFASGGVIMPEIQAKIRVKLGLVEEAKFKGTTTEPHKGGDIEVYEQNKNPLYSRVDNPTNVYPRYTRRVQEPSLKRLSTLGTDLLDMAKGRRAGQFKEWKLVNENVVYKNTPSQFATPADQLKISRDNVLGTVTPDSSFLKSSLKTKESFNVRSEAKVSLSGRSSVGGTELGQFFAPRSTRLTRLNTGETISAGRPQAYLYYSELKPFSASELLRGKVEFRIGPRKPAVGFSRSQVSDIPSDFMVSLRSRGSLSRSEYDLLSRESYKTPGSSERGTAALGNIRSELEVPKSLGSKQSVIREQKPVYFKGLGELKYFELKDIKLGKTEFIQAIDNNIGFVEGRIETLKSFNDPRARSIISKEETVLSELKDYRTELKGLNFREFPKYAETPKLGSKTPSKAKAFTTEELSFLDDVNTRSLASSSTKTSVSVSGASFSLLSFSASGASSSFSTSNISSSLSSSGSSASFSASGASSSFSTSNISSSFSGSSISSPSASFSGGSFSGSGSSFSGSSSSFSGSSSGFSGGSSSYGGSSTTPLTTQKNILDELLKKKKRKNSKKGFYNIQVKVRGVWKNYGVQTTEAGAFSIGKNIIGTSLAASFKITTKSGKGVLPKNLGKGFRRSKNTKEKFTIVEKRGRRLSTASETMQINLAKNNGGWI